MARIPGSQTGPVARAGMSRRTGMGEIFSISSPLGQPNHLVSHLHLPLEALEEARLVRKAGWGKEERDWEWQAYLLGAYIKKQQQMRSLAIPARAVQKNPIDVAELVCLLTGKAPYSR